MRRPEGPGLLRRFAPRNDGVWHRPRGCHCERSEAIPLAAATAESAGTSRWRQAGGRKQYRKRQTAGDCFAASRLAMTVRSSGLLRRFASRNDGVWHRPRGCHCERSEAIPLAAVTALSAESSRAAGVRRLCLARSAFAGLAPVRRFLFRCMRFGTGPGRAPGLGGCRAGLVPSRGRAGRLP